MVQPLLVRLSKIDGHLLHGGEDDQHVGVQLLRQHLAGEVLVDHRRRALEVVPLGLEDGDAASAAGHHDVVALHQGLDGVQLDDGHRLGGGHHTAPAPAGILRHIIAPLCHHALGLFLGHESADGLGGVPERRVLGVHLHLGEDGGHALLDIPVQQLLPQGVLEVIADVALAHGNAHGQGAGDILFRIGAGELGHGLLDHAHLGAVSVGHDHLVATLDQVGDGPGGLLYRRHLLRQVIAQGIAAQGHYDTFTHDWCNLFQK